MFIVQVNDSDGILVNIVHIGFDRDLAELQFIKACATTRSPIGKKLHPDQLLDDGYKIFVGGVVMFIDIDGFVSDRELLDKLQMMQSEGVI